jgi:hypothetical protein
MLGANANRNYKINRPVGLISFRKVIANLFNDVVPFIIYSSAPLNNLVIIGANFQA